MKDRGIEVQRNRNFIVIKFTNVRILFGLFLKHFCAIENIWINRNLIWNVTCLHALENYFQYKFFCVVYHNYYWCICSWNFGGLMGVKGGVLSILAKYLGSCIIRIDFIHENMEFGPKNQIF